MRLSRKDEKTKRPRTLALVANCERLSRGDLRSECAGVPFCRSSNGKPIKSFRRPFKVGVKNAGLEGITPHDMRRSAIRTFTKAGVGASEGMAISGPPGPTQFLDDTTLSMRRCKSDLSASTRASEAGERRSEGRYDEASRMNSDTSLSNKKAGTVGANLIYVRRALTGNQERWINSLL
jgi:hypothetical protein